MTRINRKVVTAALVVACLSPFTALAAGAKGVVNINTADAQQLMLLPRVGPSVAERIIEYRDKNGRFKSLEDLMLVRGIGEKTFQLIKPHIAVSGETTLTEKVRVSKSQSSGP